MSGKTDCLIRAQEIFFYCFREQLVSKQAEVHRVGKNRHITFGIRVKVERVESICRIDEYRALGLCRVGDPQRNAMPMQNAPRQKTLQISRWCFNRPQGRRGTGTHSRGAKAALDERAKNKFFRSMIHRVHNKFHSQTNVELIELTKRLRAERCRISGFSFKYFTKTSRS